MNGRGVHALGERVAKRATVVPVFHRNTHFDQFMRGESAVRLGGEFWRDARMADPHDRFQRMRTGLQVGPLT